jgi:hypothetical protein
VITGSLALDVSNIDILLLFKYHPFFFLDTASTSFQPLLLTFEKIHYITIKSFFRLWNEMEATVDDIPKVSVLVISQLKFALKDEATKQLYEFEKDMLEVEYKVIRGRQLRIRIKR